MSEFSDKLNDLIVETFKSILKVEEQSLRMSSTGNLSISEMHLIEAVDKDKDKESGSTISEIANRLDITLSSVTIAINKLVKKEYVEKIKCKDDGRVVYVKLTKKGRKVNAAHRYFHLQMTRNLSDDFSEDEKKILLRGIDKMNGFFKNKLR